MSDQIERIKNEIAQLEAETAPVTLDSLSISSDDRTKLQQKTEAKKVDNGPLATMKRLLQEIETDDPAPYINAHKKCAVCLRHNPKEAAACELCGSNAQWEPVTDHHPTCHPIGRRYPSTREHLSNIRAWFRLPFDPAHLRWLLTWREADGTRQINAAKFVPTPFVLSYDQRCWCKRLLEWIEPGVIIPEPEADEPEPEIKVDVIEAPATKEAPKDFSNYFEYQEWKVQREAEKKPASVGDWIGETKRLGSDGPNPHDDAAQN